MRPLRPILLSLLLLSVAMGQQLARRLILKDGSYQPATKWEIKGERVRYYSAERFEWEELPKSIVDWAATNKYNQELASGEAATSAKLSKEDEAERQARAARTPAVAPGLKLPDTGGVYLLDQFQNRPELAELVQSGGEIHKNMGRNILRAAINPIATSTQSIEIKGARARVQAHEPVPAIFVDIVESDNNAAPPDDAAQRDPKEPAPPPVQDRFRIVRARKKKDTRVVANLKIAFYGKMRQQADSIPTTIEPVTSEWVKVTPAKPLPPGEYALVEMLGKNQINLYVWDFGVDPNAPPNPPTWVPVQPKQTPTGTTAAPVLEQRPH